MPIACFQVSDRERSLDSALLQSGKFNDALDSLLSWLSETEDMVANQKPPSPEFRVVKAQLQEQKVSVGRTLFEVTDCFGVLFS